MTHEPKSLLKALGRYGLRSSRSGSFHVQFTGKSGSHLIGVRRHRGNGRVSAGSEGWFPGAQSEYCRRSARGCLIGERWDLARQWVINWGRVRAAFSSKESKLPVATKFADHLANKTAGEKCQSVRWGLGSGLHWARKTPEPSAGADEHRARPGRTHRRRKKKSAALSRDRGHAWRLGKSA